jgi:hypothetical protein
VRVAQQMPPRVFRNDQAFVLAYINNESGIATECDNLFLTNAINLHRRQLNIDHIYTTADVMLCGHIGLRGLYRFI